MTHNLDLTFSMPIASTHYFWDFEVSSMYPGLMLDYTSYDTYAPMSIKIKHGKGRKGRPHWRHFRALQCDVLWKAHWTKMGEAFQQYKVDNNLSPFWNSTAFKEWITPQLQNARVVFDFQYDGCMAIDFDNDDARVLFYLQWS